MTDPILLELDWSPSVNTYYRNVLIGGRCRTILSERARDYRAAVQSAFWAWGREWDSRLWAQWQPLSGRLDVRVVLHAPTRTKYDIDNRLKAVLDALQHAGVFLDDEQVDSLSVDRGDVRPRDGAAIVQVQEVTNDAG